MLAAHHRDHYPEAVPDTTHTSTGGSQPIIVPADVRAKHGEIVDLILASESMNDDERRYWIDILPVMTPDQIDKLRGILVREREQLAAIDAKYASDMTQLSDAQALRQRANERVQRSHERSATEEAAKAAELEAAENLLNQASDL